MFGRWRRRREETQAVQAEAERLVRDAPVGRAYSLACEALDAAPPNTPEASRALRVRAAVRRLVRPGPDTATRMAQDDGRL